MRPDPPPLLETRGLGKTFGPMPGLFNPHPSQVHALRDISLTIAKGETFGLVGESGSGKSTLGRCIALLDRPSEGQALFDGQDLGQLDAAGLRRVRRDIQIVFQDPFASLNPRKTIGAALASSMRVHDLCPPSEWPERIAHLLETVGLRPDHAARYPHEFSGGQRQRICIARALTLNPRLVIADEPVSALDVSIQAQILNLMMALQKSFGLSYLFISHDLRVVRHISDRIGVMYLGRIVETAPTPALYREPLHPYTRSLLAAVPRMRLPGKPPPEPRPILRGELPSPLRPPAGCAFHTRCPMAEEICRRDRPALREVAPGRSAACHFVSPADGSPSGKSMEKVDGEFSAH